MSQIKTVKHEKKNVSRSISPGTFVALDAEREISGVPGRCLDAIISTIVIASGRGALGGAVGPEPAPPADPEQATGGGNVPQVVDELARNGRLVRVNESGRRSAAGKSRKARRGRENSGPAGEPKRGIPNFGEGGRARPASSPGNWPAGHPPSRRPANISTRSGRRCRMLDTTPLATRSLIDRCALDSVGEPHSDNRLFGDDLQGTLPSANRFEVGEPVFRAFSLQPPPGPAEQLIGAQLPNHSARTEHDDVVAQRLDLVQVGRGQQDGNPRPSHRSDVLPDPMPVVAVDTQRRLIQDQQFRFMD